MLFVGVGNVLEFYVIFSMSQRKGKQDEKTVVCHLSLSFSSLTGAHFWGQSAGDNPLFPGSVKFSPDYFLAPEDPTYTNTH